MRRSLQASFALSILLSVGGLSASTNVETHGVDTGESALIVDFDDHLTRAELETLERDYGIDLELNSVHSQETNLFRSIRLGTEDAESLLQALLGDPRVESAEMEAVYWATFEPNDPNYKYQWHFQQVHMPDAWELTSGAGVVVAVIDTGVAYEDYEDSIRKYHLVEDLRGVSFVPGYDFVNNDEHANDDHGHGTHVAGTIAQATNNGVGVAGMAYHCSIMPLKVLSKQGFGKTADIADAIRFAADHGAHVINMSLGGRFPSKIMRDAIHYAHSKGVTVVAAAGNNGSRRVSYPAAYPHTIAVSATRFDENLTWYSNYGKEIDLAAPGGDTKVDQNDDGYPDGVLQNTIVIQKPEQEGYFLFQGTSMASPHVAGAAAMVVSQGITSPDKVEEILKATARKKGGEEWNEKYGAGIVDASAAAAKAGSSSRFASLVFALFATAGLIVMGSKIRSVGVVGYTFGALLGSLGFSLTFLGDLAGFGSLLTHPVPQWAGLLFGADQFGNPAVLSVVLPLLIVLTLYGFKKLRGVLAGLSVGFCAYFAAQAYLGHLDVLVIPNCLGSLLDRSWLVAQSGLTLTLAWLMLKRPAN